MSGLKLQDPRKQAIEITTITLEKEVE